MSQFRYEYPPETIVNAGDEWSRLIDDPERAGRPIEDDGWFPGLYRVRSTRRQFGHILCPELVLANEITLHFDKPYPESTKIVMIELVRDTPMPDAVRPVPCPVCNAETVTVTLIDGYVKTVMASFCPFRNKTQGTSLMCRDGWMTADKARVVMYAIADQDSPANGQPWYEPIPLYRT